MGTTRRLLLAGLALAAGCSIVNDPSKIEPGPDTSTPAVPAGLTATPGKTDVKLAWEAVTDWDLDHYTVFFARPGQSLEKAGDSAAPAFTVPSLDPTKAYAFMVLSVDRFGNVSDPSNVVTAQPDSVAPTALASFNPGPPAGASTMTDVIFTFSEPMDPASVTSGASVTASAGVTPACVWTWYSGDTEAKCDLVKGGNPATPLDFSTTYTVTLPAAAADRAGNALAGPRAGTFTTTNVPDTTPPALVSVVVSNHQSSAQAVSTGSPGAQGVFPETNVVITFSEPMDTVATAGAVSVTAGPGYNGGSKTWNAGGTILTFNPDVNYPNDTVVTISFAAGAQDPAGNDLPATASRTFRTARSGSVVLESEAAIDGYGYVTQGGGSTDVYPVSGSSMVVGDSSANGQYKGFVSFSRAGLPATLTRFTAATLGVHQYATTGLPYSDLDRQTFCRLNPITGTTTCFFDDLLAVHVNLGASLDAGDMTTPALTGHVELATSATLGAWSASVLGAVEDDRTNARGRSQWRIEFPVATDGAGDTDTASLYTAEASAGFRPTLSVTYEYY